MVEEQALTREGCMDQVRHLWKTHTDSQVRRRLYGTAPRDRRTRAVV